MTIASYPKTDIFNCWYVVDECYGHCSWLHAGLHWYEDQSKSVTPIPETFSRLNTQLRWQK